MSAFTTLLDTALLAQQGSPGKTGGIAIIAGVVVGTVVAFALLVWLLSLVRRRWRTRPEETHSYGDVGRVAGAREAPPDQRPEALR